MSAKHPLAPASKVIKLYYARELIVLAIEYAVCAIILSCLMYYLVRWMAINVEGFSESFIIVHETLFIRLLEFFVAASLLDVVSKVLRCLDVVFLRYGNIQNGRCRCGESHQNELLILASYSMVYVNPRMSRLEISCAHCHQMMYHCNTCTDEDIVGVTAK